LSRQPLPEALRELKEATATIASGGCSWIKDMGEKITTQPQKYTDYVMGGKTLYRNIPHRAGSEDFATANSVEGKPRRAIGGTRRKTEDNCTVGSPILLARHA